jgi:hypothetical protein
MFIRLAAYANALRLLSADAALYRFQTALRRNVQLPRRRLAILDLGLARLPVL